MEDVANLSLSPISAVLLFILIFLTFFSRGIWATIPLLVSAFYITSAQGIELGSASLYFNRILCLAYLVRFMIRNEFNRIMPLLSVDILTLLWLFLYIIMVFFQKNNEGILVHHIGRVIDIGVTYFCFRLFVSDFVDFQKLVLFILFMFMPVVVFMVYEKMTSYNIFSFFGGVSQYSTIRENVIRAQGPFQHPITAGTTAASLIPLFTYLLITLRRYRIYTLIGLCGIVATIYSTGSSGPIMTAIFACIGLSAWYVRNEMRLVRYSILLSCVFAEIFMKAHFWYILAKIDLVGGSTGWHRAELITKALYHLDEWWIAGTNYTRHWMPTGVAWSANHTDITNMYINQGVSGGLLLLILFITIIVISFKNIGKALHSASVPEKRFIFLFWILGATLFSHVLTFFTISYFDQIQIFYFMLIASIVSLTAPFIKGQNRPFRASVSS